MDLTYQLAAKNAQLFGPVSEGTGAATLEEDNVSK